MPAPIKRLLVVAVCVLASWYAHKPLLGAGFLGSDAAVLEEVAGKTDYVTFGSEKISVRSYLKRFLFADDRINERVELL